MQKGITPQRRRQFQIKSLAAVTGVFLGLQVLFLNAAPINSGKASLHATPSQYAPGQILVQAKPGISDEKLADKAGKHNGKSKKKIHQIRLHVIEVPVGSEVSIAEAMAQDPDIEFAEVDARIAPIEILNDPNIGSQWHLPKINAPAAWDVSHGDDVVIAILDSGVDGNHPDLAAKMVAGYNFYDNNTNSADVHGHGTKVAGSAAAIGNNLVGGAGVAWGSKIMPIRVSDLQGYAYWSTLASGLTWAADHGARVANMSYQAHLGSSVVSAAQYFMSKGGVAVNSAGNTSAVDSTPPSDYLLTVAATDSADNRTSWSTYGPFVDVSAPGAGIYTTAMGGGYASVNGTSFSSPITAGVIALMMKANPSLSPAKLVELLKGSTKDLGDAGWDQYYGTGRVDAAAAVLAAANAPVVTDSQVPSVAFSGLASGANVSGVVVINATASDNVAVARVELLVNNALVGSDTTSPYQFNWDSLSVPDSAVSLTLRAVDTAGLVKSVSISVNVRNTADTLAPVVSISNPTSGAILKSNTTIQASASDNVGVVQMILFVDGVQKASSATGSISYSLNVKKLSTGAHTIRVDARDSSGNLGTKTISFSK
jgi:thermitase